MSKFTYNNFEYNINDVYSFKDFTGRAAHVLEDISGIVYASCFSNETPDAHIFPDNISGVIFIKCNLDNVFIPVGNTVIDCSQRRFKVQNDGNDWLIDGASKPTLPINHKIFTKFGLPMPKPMDIPAIRVTECVDLLEVAKTKKLEVIQ